MPTVVVTLPDASTAVEEQLGSSDMSVDVHGNLRIGKQPNGDPELIYAAGKWSKARAWK